LFQKVGVRTNFGFVREFWAKGAKIKAPKGWVRAEDFCLVSIQIKEILGNKLSSMGKNVQTLNEKALLDKLRKTFICTSP